MKPFFLSLALLLACSVVSAQSERLASVTPADTVLALSITPGDVDTSDVEAAFDALDWDAAKDALAHLSRFVTETELLYEMDLDYDSIELIEGLLKSFETNDAPMSFSERLDSFIIQMSEGEDTLASVCAPLADIDTEGFNVVGEESILSVAISPFSPMPSFTAITRFADDNLEVVQNVQEAILECVREQDEEAVLELEQGDLTFYVLADGSDLPLIIGNVGEFFFITTNPDSARNIIRLAQGSDEDSYADSDFFQNQAALSEGHGYRIAVDYAAIADFAQNLRGFVVQDDVSEYLFDRGVAFLRTLNTASGQIIITDDGLLLEDAVVVNPEGGDEELTALLLCEDCTTSIPEFLPADTVAASAQYIGVEDFFDYLQTWFDDLSEITGEDLTITDLANEFGIDLETLVFDWLGDTWVNAQLEVTGGSLASWVYEPQSATLIKVKSEDATNAGRAAWNELVPQLFELLSFVTDMTGRDLGGFEYLDLYGDVAYEQRDYRGYTLDRYRWSVNVDITTFYLERDDETYLVLVSPLDAAEAFIDALEAGESLADNTGYQTLLDNAPENAPLVAFSDSHANAQILAEIAQTSSQPTAALFTLGMNAAYEEYLEYASYDDYDYDRYDTPSGLVDDEFLPYEELRHDVYQLDPSLLDLSEETSLSIDATLISPENDADVDDSNPLDYYALDLADLDDASAVEVVLESTDFDTYLQLINADTGEVMDANDDFAGGTNSAVRFTPEEGINYVVEASALQEQSSGDYTLRVTVVDASEASSNDDTASYRIELPEEITNSISLGADTDARIEGNFYLLEDLTIDEEVTIMLKGTSVDTYLRVVNAETGEVLHENDDFDSQPNVSAVSFVPAEGITYAIQVSTYQQVVDDYSFNLSVEEGALESEEESAASLESTEDDYTAVVELPDTLDSIALGDSREGSIVGVSEDSATEEVTSLSDFYALVGIEEGAQVSVTLESDDFDAKLYIIDEAAEAYVAANDDYDGSNSFLRFTSGEDASYIIEVNNFYGLLGGDYTLTVDVEPASEEVEETTEEVEEESVEEEITPLSFAEWLSITDLGYEALEVITDRLSESYGFGEVDGTTIHHYDLIGFDW